MLNKLSERRPKLKAPKPKIVREIKPLTNDMIITELILRLKSFQIENLTSDEQELLAILTAPRGVEHRNKRWLLNSIKLCLNFMLKHNLINIKGIKK